MNIKPYEQFVSQLLGTKNEQFIIPSYQRRYSWQTKQVSELISDIESIKKDDTHLLGSVVLLTDHYSAGIVQLELVDGQQRITTLIILLHCIWERLDKEKEVKNYAKDIESYLKANARGERPQHKIFLDSMDANEFERHMASETIDNPTNKPLANSFRFCREWVESQQIEELKEFVENLLDKTIIIRLHISNAKDAYTLFEIINNRGLRLSSVDIIKNFILGDAANNGDDALRVAKEKWAELLSALDGLNAEDFFRNYLCAEQQRRVTGAYVIPVFKAQFFQQVIDSKKQKPTFKVSGLSEADEEALEGTLEADDIDTDDAIVKTLTTLEQMSFKEFMTKMAEYAKIYRKIVKAETGIPGLDRRLRNLQLINAAQTHGFLMALRAKGCADKSFETVLKLTESFLLRRHICKERSNENESIFARLCGVDPNNPIPDIKKAFLTNLPSDEEFHQSLRNYDFKNNINRARYCLEQLEINQLGNYQETAILGSETVEVEHIIPQKISDRRIKGDYDNWINYLNEKSFENYKKSLSKIGNLTLFHGSLNVIASNHPYEEKKKAYKESSIRITNSLPDKYPEFRLTEIDTRSKELAELALRVWPLSDFEIQ